MVVKHVLTWHAEQDLHVPHLLQERQFMQIVSDE
jgi:hypothetical protein